MAFFLMAEARTGVAFVLAPEDETAGKQEGSHQEEKNQSQK